MGNMCDRLKKEEKQRLRVSNIYDHNAFMMLDKEREAERLAKVYKKKNIKNVKNGELQFSTKRIKMKEDNGCYHYIYIYIHARAQVEGKTFLFEIIIGYYVHTMLLQASAARKELQRLQHKAKEFSIKPVCDSRMNHLEERENDMIQARSDSDF